MLQRGWHICRLGRGPQTSRLTSHRHLIAETQTLVNVSCLWMANLGHLRKTSTQGVAMIKIKHKASTYTQVTEQTWYAL